MLLMLFTAQVSARDLVLDESPAAGGEWGYRPAPGDISMVNPPSFSWRPQDGLVWEVECSADTSFSNITYKSFDIFYNVHCPSTVFTPGTYAWRYRGKDAQGYYTNWSEPRTFSVSPDAAEMPLPEMNDLIARIPKTHPRLFVRPENLDNLRRLAQNQLKDRYDKLVDECDRILADPPPVDEPPLYPEGTVRNSDPWREIWWGNRMYVIAALNGAATLAFTRLLDGNERYGSEAKRILLACAKWDPKGSTGYRYNDEAGMPYAYYFSRTYTFVNDMLTEEEKQLCRDVMKIRGDEMYEHLYSRHLWQPYSSHSNRAWHFLGEVGITFLGEVESAEEWVWFATNVFYNVYPVWSDDDGGWHEGTAYWTSYQDRFTWWADVMREALGINAFDKPYYSKAGYYAMYLMPPGKTGGGFGDLTANITSSKLIPIMTTFASQANNGHWQWWVEQSGEPSPADGYIGFIRGSLPRVQVVPPDDLPSSRLFEGIGQAYMNSNLTDANECVQVVFKSSPFGTQSHGYEANNSFLLWAYGKRLLIRSGRRDSYGSDHHVNWMWSTRSVNCIRINGQDQSKRSVKAQGKITEFRSTPSVDIVTGETENFCRSIIFVKPELIIVFDRLKSDTPANYEYWLHAVNEMKIENQHSVTVRNDDVVCDIDFLAPETLDFTQTDQYDPNPRPRITLREWHLTATTREKKQTMEFVTLYRPHRISEDLPSTALLERVDGGYVLTAELSDGNLTALLPVDNRAVLAAQGINGRGEIKVLLSRDGNADEIIGIKK